MFIPTNSHLRAVACPVTGASHASHYCSPVTEHTLLTHTLRSAQYQFYSAEWIDWHSMMSESECWSVDDVICGTVAHLICSFLLFCTSCLSEGHVDVVFSQNQVWQSKGTVLSLLYYICYLFDMEINCLLYQSEIALLLLLILNMPKIPE